MSHIDCSRLSVCEISPAAVGELAMAGEAGGLWIFLVRVKSNDPGFKLSPYSFCRLSVL